MKKFFYTDGTNKYGPYTIDELREQEITGETEVWFQGSEDWIPADEVEELEYLFSNSLPPQKEEVKEFTNILIKTNANGAKERVSLSRWNQMKKYYGEDKFTIIAYLDEYGNIISDKSKLKKKKRPPKTYLTESILVTLFCCLPFGIVGIVNASKVESRYYAGDIDGAKISSEEAKKWVSFGFWSGLIISVIYLVINISGIIGGL